MSAKAALDALWASATPCARLEFWLFRMLPLIAKVEERAIEPLELETTSPRMEL